MSRAVVSLLAGAVVLVAGSVALAEDTDGVESSLNAGVTLTEGNSETLQVNVGLRAKRVSGSSELTAGADYNYGETGTNTTVENVSANVMFKQAVRERCYLYVAADYLYDDIAAVDYRVTVGPGLGLLFVKDEATALALEVGAVWVTDEVAGVEDDYPALRAAQTFERKLNASAKLWESVAYISEFDDFDNYTLVAEIGVESALSETVSLRVVAQDRFDNTPGIVGGKALDDNDFTLIAGVGIKL